MVASMNHTDQSEVTIPLNVVNHGNDLSDPPLEQRTPSCNGGSGRNEQNVGRCRLKFIKYIITAVMALFPLSVSYNIFSYAQMKQLEAKMNQLEAEVKQLKATSTTNPFPTTLCSQGWTPNAEWCYRFSDTESTWNWSLMNCSSYGASLFVMATPQEMTFINENKAPAEYWIGLRRVAIIGEPWKQTDGSDFNVWFEIKGEGLCASLNDGVVSSTDCDSYRRWICRKPLLAA